MSANIAVLTTGIYNNPILDSLLNQENLNFFIICSNILDFELPPKTKNGNPQWYRHELRQVLRQIAPDLYKISPSLKNLLEENDRLDLNELDLAITSHISQIEQNSTNLDKAYDLLLQETQVQNISLIPLTEENPSLFAFKDKKYAPIRYFFEKEEMLSEEPPQKHDKSKRKYNEKKLVVENLDVLQNIKLSEASNKAMQESDLIIILTSDIVSFGSLVRANEIEKQIKKMNTPIVIIWPFEAERNPSSVEEEIAEAMEFGPTLDLLADDVANLTDYMIIKKSDKDYIETLRKAGCHVLTEEIWDDDDGVSDSLINTVFSIGNISELIKERRETQAEKDKTDNETEEKKVEKSTKEDLDSEIDTTTKSEVMGKSISQLTESPEEAGKIRIVSDEEDIKIEENDKKLEEQIESVSENNTELETKSPVGDNLSLENEESEVKIQDATFETIKEEEWGDTVNRAIELRFENDNLDALSWLVEQSKQDNDNEVQIAQQVINTWVESRTNILRRRGAEFISKISEDRRDTYKQILEKHMISAVTDGKEDMRRRLLPLISLLNDVDNNLSETLIKGLTRQLSLLKENHDIAVVEKAKLTLLQLVIQNKKLSKVTINELLNLLESRPNIGSEIWNILLAFDAGTVALELVTNFSLSKAEEVVRRSNLLRFTGSYYATFSKVMKAWKEGDKVAISSATGTILPEETLRKFERLELARKLEKLKMVQLSTLAESLGKDVETVERLITELIVNDELHAKMKLIEDKMYLVSEEDVSTQK